MEPKVYGCKDAKYDIDFFFQCKQIHFNTKAENGLKRALDHMTKGSTVKLHNISCQLCWDYYMGMKTKHCGG